MKVGFRCPCVLWSGHNPADVVVLLALLISCYVRLIPVGVLSITLLSLFSKCGLSILVYRLAKGEFEFRVLLFNSRHARQRTENCDIQSVVQPVLWPVNLRNQSRHHPVLSDNSTRVSIRSPDLPVLPQQGKHD